VDAAALARHWLGQGVKLVVITSGSGGAEVFFQAENFAVHAREVVLVDSVGAGDSFHAALLVSLQEQGFLHPQKLGLAPISAIRQAARHAAVAASITCTRRGADLPTQAELASALS
jgi:fructokinase